MNNTKVGRVIRHYEGIIDSGDFEVLTLPRNDATTAVNLLKDQNVSGMECFTFQMLYNALTGNFEQDLRKKRNMTVDQMLVYIPQLTARKKKLSVMKGRLPKQRKIEDRFGHTGIIDYLYTNYDIKAVEADYHAVADELAKAQAALDTLNNTVLMEIDA